MIFENPFQPEVFYEHMGKLCSNGGILGISQNRGLKMLGLLLPPQQLGFDVGPISFPIVTDHH